MAVNGRLVFDPTDANSQEASSNTGAYVRAGSDGDLIASQTIAAEEWLNVAAALHDGSGNAITSTGGALNVSSAGSHLEDTAHTSGDTGNFPMAIRVDSLTAVPATALAGTELDYQGLIGDTDGALFTASKTLDGTGNAIGSTSGALDVNVTNTIDVDDGLANTTILNEAVSVGTTAIDTTVAAPIAGRKYLAVANEGNKKGYFGMPGLTTANGFPLHAGMQHVWRIGPALTPEFIGGTGASAEDYRTMQLA